MTLVIMTALLGWVVGGFVSRCLLADSFAENAERWDDIAVRWRALGHEDKARDAERCAAKDRNVKWWGIV